MNITAILFDKDRNEVARVRVSATTGVVVLSDTRVYPQSRTFIYRSMTRPSVVAHFDEVEPYWVSTNDFIKL